MWLLLYGILFLASVYFCTNLITSTNKSLRRGPYAGVYTRPGSHPSVFLQGVPTILGRDVLVSYIRAFESCLDALWKWFVW